MSERSAIEGYDTGPSGPDGATAPRAEGAERRAATRAERTIERSERPAIEGT